MRRNNLILGSVALLGVLGLSSCDLKKEEEKKKAITLEHADNLSEIGLVQSDFMKIGDMQNFWMNYFSPSTQHELGDIIGNSLWSPSVQHPSAIAIDGHDAYLWMEIGNPTSIPGYSDSGRELGPDYFSKSSLSSSAVNDIQNAMNRVPIDSVEAKEFIRACMAYQMPSLNRQVYSTPYTVILPNTRNEALIDVSSSGLIGGWNIFASSSWNPSSETMDSIDSERAVNGQDDGDSYTGFSANAYSINTARKDIFKAEEESADYIASH